jgi:hypothetical protein
VGLFEPVPALATTGGVLEWNGRGRGMSAPEATLAAEDEEVAMRGWPERALNSIRLG